MSKRFTLVKAERINQAKRFRELAVVTRRVLKLGDLSWYLEANPQKLTRIAISVPKKHIPSAVQRNYIKRLIREAFRLRKKRFVASDLLVKVSGNVVTKALIDEGFNKLDCT